MDVIEYESNQHGTVGEWHEIHARKIWQPGDGKESINFLGQARDEYEEVPRLTVWESNEIIKNGREVRHVCPIGKAGACSAIIWSDWMKILIFRQ